MKSRLLLTILITTVLFSCKKDTVDTPVTPSPINTTSGSIYISNEGNFQSANSTITIFNTENSQTIDDAFFTANGESIGDICQSMKLINGNLYIVVNNSGKIEVCEKNTLQRIQTITGLSSPRYIVPVNSTKAYVSDLAANHISIIDLTTNVISGTIPLNGWTEQMLVWDNKVYVTNISTQYLYVIDALTDIITDSIHISPGGNSLVLDKNAQIWVLCGGDFITSTPGALYKIEPNTNQIRLTLPFTQTDYSTRLIINSTVDSIYFLNTNVFKMGVSDQELPSSPFIISSSNNFYGLGIDPVKNIIYVTDAFDYIQRGRIYRYNSDGSSIDNFLAGIIPGEMLYIPE